MERVLGIFTCWHSLSFLLSRKMFIYTFSWFFCYLWKAVVNEDTQGNVSQLQAEIKKLKEQLAQLTSVPSVCSISVSQGKSCKWRRICYFCSPEGWGHSLNFWTVNIFVGTDLQGSHFPYGSCFLYLYLLPCRNC